MNYIIMIKVKLSCKMVAYSKVTLTYNVTYTFHYFCMCIYIHLLYIFVTVIQCSVHDIAGWLMLIYIFKLSLLFIRYLTECCINGYVICMCDC